MEKNVQKMLLRIIQVCLISILFLPLLVTKSTAFPFTVGKVIFFQIFIDIACAAWISLCIMNKKFRPPWKHPLVLAPLGFLLALCVTAATGVDFYNSLWSSQERMLGLVTYAYCYVWFLLLLSVYKSWSEWRIFLITTLSVGCVVLLYGLHKGPLWQMQSTLGNQLFLGAYALLHFFLACFLFFYEKNRLIKIFSALTGTGSFAALFFTGERGPVVALCFGVVLLPFLLLSIPSKKAKLASVSLCIGIIAVFVSVLWLKTPAGEVVGQKYLPHTFTKVLYNFSNGFLQRKIVWSIGIQGFKERPLFGWGWENFNVIFNAHTDPVINKTFITESWYDRSHNQIIDILALSGCVGLIFYILFNVLFTWFIGRAFISEKEIHKRVAYSFLALLFICYFIQNLNVFDTLGVLIIFYFSLALLYFVCTTHTSKRTESEKIFFDKRVLFLIYLIFLVAFYFAYSVSLRSFHKSQLSIQARRVIISQGDMSKGLNIFKEALSESSFTNREIRQNLIEIMFQLIQRKLISDDQKKEWVSFARQEIEKSVKEHPFDVRQYLIASAVYRADQQFDQEALEQAEKAVNQAMILSPKRIEGYLEYSQVETQKKDFDKAYFWAQKAIDEAQNLEGRNNALWNRVTVSIRAERWKDAVQDMQTNLDNGYQGYDAMTSMVFYIATHIQKIPDSGFEHNIITLIEELKTKKISSQLYASTILIFNKTGEQKKEKFAFTELRAFDIQAAEQVEELLEDQKVTQFNNFVQMGEWNSAYDVIITAYNEGYNVEKQTKMIYLFSQKIPKPIDQKITSSIIAITQKLRTIKVSEELFMSDVLLYYKAGEQDKTTKALQVLNNFSNDATAQVKKMIQDKAPLKN